MKMMYQPSKRRRARMTGFRKRNSTKAGKAILKRRRLKGRWQVTPTLAKFR